MATGGRQKDLKKTGHFVPSRYKQAAEKIATQSSTSKEKSTFLKNSRDDQGLQISGNVSQDTSNSSKHSTSSDSRGMTSTPSSSKRQLSLPLLDASVVTDASGHLTVPYVKERIGPSSMDYSKRNIAKKYKTHDETFQSQRVTLSYKDNKKGDSYNEKLSEAEIDLLYTYYLQAIFLESEAKKALIARSSSSVEILHRLFCLVLQDLCKVKSQRSMLKLYSSLIAMHEHCQKQENILKPVFEVIPNLEEQYKSLATAVNSTKHKLHVKNILLPDPDLEGEIVKILQEMKQFLSDFFELLPNCKDTISSSDVLENYVDASELVTEAMKRGFKLLIEAKDLCFSEASLSY